MDSAKVEFADTLRGVAAVSVLVSHLLGVFWHRREVTASLTKLPPLDPSIQTPAFIDFLDPALPIWAAFGIGLFFLVSGFVIPFSLDRYSRIGFLVARLFRLWPTYFVGCLFTAGVILFGTAVAGEPQPFSLVYALSHAVLGVREAMGWRSLDGIVWTLEIEVKFYLVAALIAPWIRSGSRLTFTVPWVLLGLVVLGAFVHLNRTLLIGFQFLIFMFAGVALNFAFRNLLPKREMLIAAFSCLVAFIMTTYLGPFRQISYALLYIVPLTVFSALMFRPALLPDGTVVRFLAKISYPLYVVHGVPGYVLLALLLQRGWPPISALLLAVLLALVLAYFLHKAVEAPSHMLGKSLGRQFPYRGHRGGSVAKAEV